jgi:hypothetical protein
MDLEHGPTNSGDDSGSGPVAARTILLTGCGSCPTPSHPCTLRESGIARMAETKT